MNNIDLLKFQCKYWCHFEDKVYIIKWINTIEELRVSENELDAVVGLIAGMDFNSFREFQRTYILGMFDVIE